MNSEKELNDQLDKYIKGQTSIEESSLIESKMKVDPDFKRKVDQLRETIDSLKLVHERNRLKQILNEADSEIEDSKIIPLKRSSDTWKQVWITIAVAASVAGISVFGTLMFVRPPSASFSPTGRKIDEIQRSQKVIIKDLNDIKRKITPSPGKYAGTGFLISSKGYAATSYHVVKEADSILVENEKFGLLKARIVFNDPINDISIFKIDDLPLITVPYTVSASEASIAEEAYTLGYPREDIVFGEGSISALTGYRESENAYQISIPVNPGNSGGPLLNSKGDLIGMISGIQTQTLGVAFAIKSSVLLGAVADSTLDSLRVPIFLPKQNLIKSNSRVQQVAKWKDFVFMVRVYKN